MNARLERNTLGKLLARVRKEVRSQPSRRFVRSAYFKELSAPLQSEIRRELEAKRHCDSDQNFTFTPEQVGRLVIRYYSGQGVEPL